MDKINVTKNEVNQFFQDAPSLANTFTSDQALQKLIKNRIPTEYQTHIQTHLEKVGEMAVGSWLEWSRYAETHKPELISFDPWGRRIDHIETSPAWKNLEMAAATEGIVATAFERKYAQYSRLYQTMLLYLFHPSSAFFSCPLAMTDGAARAIELYGDEYLKSHALKRLTSRDPKNFWTSGQWMTERTGGSDVSGTSTVAQKTSEENIYELHGTKWFTSATTSQMALTLACIESDPEGSRGLSLFYLELRDENGLLNDIEVHRLKNKLGTDALPTAELSLKGTRARLIGKPCEGVKRIASVLNITRIYNSVCALGHMRRALDLAQNYSLKRKAFGALLAHHPLHQQTLCELEAEFIKCFKFTFYVAELLGKEECGLASDIEKKLLRILTPLVKLYTGKKCMSLVSEVIEIFGGAGYVEDTGLPRLLRDAQVFSIWEGTTNVLTLDFFRVCEKEQGLEVLIEHLKSRGVSASQLADIGQSKYRELKNGRELVFKLSEILVSYLD